MSQKSQNKLQMRTTCQKMQRSEQIKKIIIKRKDKRCQVFIDYLCTVLLTIIRKTDKMVQHFFSMIRTIHSITIELPWISFTWSNCNDYHWTMGMLNFLTFTSSLNFSVSSGICFWFDKFCLHILKIIPWKTTEIDSISDRN